MNDDNLARELALRNLAYAYWPALDLLHELTDSQLSDMILTVYELRRQHPEHVVDLNRIKALLDRAMHSRTE